MIITIDGPTASGKSTVAHSLAKKLGFYYIDSGLFYRELSYLLVTRANYTIADLSNIKESDIQLYTSRCHYIYDHNGAHVLYEETDITPHLKTKDVDLYASLIGGTSAVRIGIEENMRVLARNKDLVIDGRDTGSVVFPQADYKFFLTASLAVRAARWQVDQAKKAIVVTLAQAKEAVHARDERDTSRPVAPLCIPQGAHVIDSSTFTKEQTVEAFLKIIHQT